MKEIRVQDLWIYPVKGCRGVSLEEVGVTPQGFQGDRRLMIVDRRGQFISQRSHPQMARLAVVWAEPGLLQWWGPAGEVFWHRCIPEGDRRVVTVWRDRLPAIDQGEAIAQWLATVGCLGEGVRLVWQDPQVLRPIDPRYRMTADRGVSFADGFPVLLTHQASLVALNGRLQAKAIAPVPMIRFRPNLVVTGGDAFVEDTWGRFYLGRMPWIAPKPCSRCSVITMDQATGDRDPMGEPLRTLGEFRHRGDGGIVFGINVIPLGEGAIRVGDRLGVIPPSGGSGNPNPSY